MEPHWMWWSHPLLCCQLDLCPFLSTDQSVPSMKTGSVSELIQYQTHAKSILDFFLSLMPFCKRSSCIKCQIFTRIIFYERTLVSHWPKRKCWINWVLFFFNASGFTLEEDQWTDTNFEHWSSQTCEFVLAAQQIIISMFWFNFHTDMNQ